MLNGIIAGRGTDNLKDKRRSGRSLIFTVAASTLGATGLFASHAHAAVNGTWINTAGGLWGTTSNWASSNVANGSTAIADFSTVVPTAANTTVNLDSSYTVGQIKFGSTTTANNWNISNNGISTNVLTLDNGTTNQPIITVTPSGEISIIGATLSGTNGFIKTGLGALNLTGSSNYSGITVLNSTNTGTGGDIYLSNNYALGNSSLYVDPGTTALARVLLNAGISVSNNITLNTSRAASGANGALMTNGNVAGAAFMGAITINNKAGSGGHIVGPVDNTFTNFLTFGGPITLSSAYYAANPIGAPSANGVGVLIRGGNVIFSGGGSYYRAEVRSGMLRVGATNGVATNAYLDLGGNANGNPQTAGVLDLNGFNQTLVGIQNLINNGTTSYVTNTSTTPATLTLTPLAATNISSGLVFTAGSAGTGTNAYFTDNTANGGTLSLVINGDPTGAQTLNIPNSSYTGTTTLTSGTLSINTLANGGSNSAIGASSNAATNLVFNGGQLNYSGGSVSTDRNFTLNSSTTDSLAVTTTATTLTMTGGGTGGGAFTKKGSGVLLFTGSSSYTGATTVSAGTLLVNSPGSLASASNVSILSGATLGGTGIVAGAVTPAAGGIIAPAGVNAVGTLTVGALTLNTGSIINFEMTSGSGNDEITVANSNGLTINGANIDLYNPGTTTTFSTNGTYPLFNVTGSISGAVSNLSIANPAAGKVYSLVNSSGVVNLTIGSATTLEYNDGSGTNNYGDAGNWIGGAVPNAVGQSALFGSNLIGSNGAVNLSSAETVSGLIFNNSSVSYSLNGTGSLVLNNGVAAAAVDVLKGVHSINVPISLGSATALDTTNAADVLTISGAITGAKSVAVNGPGTVTLTGTNSFTTVTMNGGTLNVGNGTTGTLGTGAVSLSSGAGLNFNLSSAYNFGQTITGTNTGESVSQSGVGTVTVGALSAVSAVNVSSGLLMTTSINAGAINVTGTGSLTTSGNISGVAKLKVNTTGSVTLSGTDSYSGGTEVDTGTLTLNSGGALPGSSALAVNGGTLDLHGNSISVGNLLGTTLGGVITNSVASTTSTVSFSGSNANYNMTAGLNDGATGGKVALISFIDNTTSSPDGVGDEYNLIMSAAGNYSGGTTVNKESIEATVSNALGTGTVTLALNNASTNNTRLNIAGGVTLPNNIVIAQPNPYAGYGAVQYLAGTTGNVTLTGSITVNADALSGGTFAGPTTAGTVMNVNGPVYAGGTATTISVRSGNVGFGGGGSYPNLAVYSAVVVNAPNGIASNAVIGFNTGSIDLTGNNQTVAGLNVTSGTGLVTNSSATAAALTINTASAANFSGGILTGNLSLVKTGSATQVLAGASTYTGNTTISGGTLRLAAVAQPSLVAAYSFDNTTATPVNPAPTTIVNSGTGGSAMNGTVNGTGISIVSGGPVINGVSGNALAFNSATGTNSVIINSPITDLSSASSWAVSGWMQTTTAGSTLFSKTGSTTTWSTGNSTFYLGTGTTAGTGAGTYPSAVRYAGGWITGEPATTNVTDGAWHMVTYVDSSGTKTIYVDGVATTMATGGNQAQFATPDIGTLVQLGLATDPADGPAALNGNLDDINFFSGSLTSAQVQTLYNTNSAGAISSYVLPATTALNITASGAALDLDGDVQTVASLTGVAGSQVILGGGSLVVGDSTATTFAGSITDAGSASNGTGGSLVKQGTGKLTLSSSNSYTGSTSVNAGILELAAIGALPSGTNLTIASGGKLVADILGAATALKVGTISISGPTGQLDLNNNALIIHSSTLTTVNTLVKSGYNAGRWNGATGIISSAAQTQSSHLTALGVIVNDNGSGTPLYGSGGTLGATFAGAAPVDGDVLVKYTYYGDANLDGKVDGTDYSRIDAAYLANQSAPGSATGWYNGDFNYDGVINGSDYTLIDNAFNTQGALIASQIAPVATATSQIAGAGTSAVPEPTTLGLLGIGAIGLLGRRRRR